MKRVLRYPLAAALTVAALLGTPGRVPAAGYEAPAEQVLPNGMKVAVFPRPGVGFVQVQLSVTAGTAREGEQQRGAAPLVAQMLRQGTSSRSPETFGEDIDRLGGSLTSTALRENAIAGGAFLPSDLQAGLELLSDAVIHPIFDEATFARSRDQAVRELLRLHGDPVTASGEQLWAFAMDGEPGAREPLGDLASLFALTRESLRAFHGEHYRPDHAVLAIAGDVTPDQAFAAVTEWFGRWSGRGAPLPAPAAQPAPAGTRILLVDRPDLATATVRFGWRLPGRDSPDDLARTLAFDAFDETLRPRLDKTLPPHGDLGMEFTRLGGSSLFEVLFTVTADSARAAIERARRAVSRARGAALEPAQAAATRARALATFPQRFDTPGGTLAQWLAVASTGADAKAVLGSHAERVAALDAPAMTAALQRGWDVDRTAIVVIGPAAKLRAGLAALGTVREVRLDEPPKDLTAVAAPEPPTDAERALGRERLRLAIQAHGGLAALKGIKDQVSEAKIRLVVQGRELNGDLTTMRKEPMRMVTLTSFESVESRQVLNIDQAWSQTEGGDLREGDSSAVRAMQSGFSSDVPHLLLAAADSTTEVAARGTTRVGDKDLWAVDVQPARGSRRRLYLDPTTHLLSAMDQSEAGARGRVAAARRLYRDLRPVDGLVMPFEEEGLLEGKTVMRVTVNRMRFNSGVSETEFRKPTPLRNAPK